MPFAFALVIGIALIFLNTGAAATGAADDRYWSQWRGPNFDGVAPLGNPPVEWSETHNVAWKVEIPARGTPRPLSGAIRSSF